VPLRLVTTRSLQGSRAAAAGYATEAVKASWASLEVPALGDWGDTPTPDNFLLPRPPVASYPTNPRLNTIYWPTHAAGFAFCWFVIGESELAKLWDDYGGPRVVGLGWFDEGAPEAEKGTKAWLYALRERAVWIPSDSSERLWALPLVDYRWVLNQSGPPPVEYRGAGGAMLAALQRVQANAPLDPRDWPGATAGGVGGGANALPPFQMDVINGLGGTLGQWIDTLLALMGRRACFLPNAQAAMHAEESAANLDAAWEVWRQAVVEGGVPRNWTGVEVPNFFVGHVPVLDEPLNGLLGMPLESLIAVPGGFQPPDATMQVVLEFPLSPIGNSRTNPTPELDAARAWMRNLAARLVSWLTRPIQVVLGGTRPAALSAHVAMYEWRPTEGTTLIQGLVPGTAHWGGTRASAPCNYYQTGTVIGVGREGTNDANTRQALGSGTKYVEGLRVSSRLGDPLQGQPLSTIPPAALGAAPGTAAAEALIIDGHPLLPGTSTLAASNGVVTITGYGEVEDISGVMAGVSVLRVGQQLGGSYGHGTSINVGGTLYQSGGVSGSSPHHMWNQLPPSGGFGTVTIYTPGPAVGFLQISNLTCMSHQFSAIHRFSCGAGAGNNDPYSQLGAGPGPGGGMKDGVFGTIGIGAEATGGLVTNLGVAYDPHTAIMIGGDGRTPVAVRGIIFGPNDVPYFSTQTSGGTSYYAPDLRTPPF
jgi:hypothetical protein